MRAPSIRAAALACLCATSFAQDPLPVPQDPAPAAREPSQDETIVIARKREEVLEDVPQSITVVSGETLEAAGIRTVRDAALMVPNMNVTEFSSRRLSFPYIRGIGSGLGEPAVATYIDGVPQLTTGSTNLSLVDLDRVEFLRGPQGTLYGRNALGGLIHIISREPTSEPVFDTGLTVGEHNLQESRLSYSGPIGSDDMLLNFSALQSSRDGYTKNDFTGDDVDDRDAFYGRAQLYITPSDNSRLRIGVYGEDADDGGFVLNDIEELKDRPHRIDQDFEGEAERDVYSPSVVYEVFGDTAEFTSITAYTNWKVSETSDFDFSPADGVRRKTREDQDYFYQELRLASAEGSAIRLGDSAEMSWLAGISGFSSDSSRSSSNDFRPGLFPPPFDVTATNSGDFDDEALAAFGQVAVTFDEKLEVSAGLRFDYESKDADLTDTVEGAFPSEVTADESESYDEFIPSFGASYAVAEDVRIYALAAKGFKAGGYNLTTDSDFNEYGTEDSWTYEAGVKHSFADGRVNLSAALFYIDWEDMQLSLFDPAIGGYIVNAGESTSQGVEIEVAAEILDGFQVVTGAGYTDSEFDEFDDSFGNDTSGNDLPFAPEYTWNLGLQYDGEGPAESRWHARADYVNLGKFYYDPGNVESESYDLVNLRAGIRKGDWVFDLFLRNAFDEEYIPIALQANPADENFFIGENGAPRTFGASLRLSF